MDVVSLGFATDVMLRRLGGSQILDRGDYLVVRSPASPDFWWGNFLLMRRPPGSGDARRWLTLFRAEFPGAGHVALGVDVTDASAVDPAGLLAEGLRCERMTVMTASAITPPPHPSQDAQIRPLAGDDDWRQAAALRTVCSAGGPGDDQDFIRRQVGTERALTEAGHGTWFGAFRDGRLLSHLGLVVSGGLARYQNVETHPRARRQGLAGTLVWHAGQHGLTTRGAGMLVMVADPDEAAIRVYRSAGFTDSQAQVSFDRPPPAPES